MENFLYPFAFGATYPSGNFAPSPKKNCSSCSSIIFCELGSSGFSRYSFMIILECSIHDFHASFDTFSNTFLPSSPRHGTRSSPGNSLPNFTHFTIRVPSVTGALNGVSGPHESFATSSSPYFARILTLLHLHPNSQPLASDALSPNAHFHLQGFDCLSAASGFRLRQGLQEIQDSKTGIFLFRSRSVITVPIAHHPFLG